MTVKINDTWLKKQPAPVKGAATVWDAEIKGFGVRVYAPTKRHPWGDRSFFLNYRINGTERRFTIGNYPAWSSEAARAEAKLLRRRVDRGEDIAGDKRARREAPTVADLAERYRIEHLPTKAAGSQRNDLSMIKGEILPAIGRLKVADIDNVDIEALHRAIAKRGAPIRVNRVLSLCSKMFSLSLKRMEGEDAPWRDQQMGNPCRGVGRNAEAGRTRFFSQAELAAISEAIAAHPDRRQADCLSLIMLTGCRPHEALEARWGQFSDGVWTKDASETKQRKLTHTPLAPAALELLQRIKAERKGDDDHVFPGLKRLRIWPKIAKKAGLVSDVSAFETA